MSGRDLTQDVLALQQELATVHQRIALISQTVDTIAFRQVIPIDDNLMLVRNAMGWLVIPREETWLIAHFANGAGSHEQMTLTVINSILRSGDTVIDAGAHIGLLALPIARTIGPMGTLLALEPHPRWSRCLRETLSVNGMGNRSQVLELAASDENGVVDFFIGANSMLGSLVASQDGQSSTTVQAARLDDVVPAETRVDLIKIDTEGFESRVVSGMARIAADNPNLFVIAEFGLAHIARLGVDPVQWFAVFADVGLDVFLMIDEQAGRLRRLAFEDILQLKPIVDGSSVNILFYNRMNVRQDCLMQLLTRSGD